MTTPDERAVLARVETLLDLGRAQDARQLLLPLIATDGASADVWCHLARADLALGSWHWAQQAADRAIAADPDGEWGYRLRSRALSELHQHDAAITSAERAVALAPLLWITHVQLSEVLSAQGQGYGRAQQEAQRAVELAPHVASTHLALGIALAGLGDADQSAVEYERALELDPGNAAAMNNLGVLALRRRGGADEAARHFVRSLRANPVATPAARNVTLAGRLLLVRFTVTGSLLAVALTFGWRFGRADHLLLVVAATVLLVGAYVLWVVTVSRNLPAGVLRSAWPGWRRSWSIVGIPVLAVFLCWFVLGAQPEDLISMWLPVAIIVVRLAMTWVSGPGRGRRR